MPARSRGALLRMWQHELCVKWDLWIRRAGFVSIKRWQWRGPISRTTQQRHNSSPEGSPAPYSEAGQSKIRDPWKSGLRISLSNTRLGHEISTQKLPRVTVRLVRQKGNFLAHIRCRPPPQQPVGVSEICAYYPELHPTKFSCRRNYGTQSKRLENRTPGDTESILSPR